jgi:amidohydrolase
MDVIASPHRDLVDRAIGIRRDLHRHPEIAFEEVRTSALIADHLRTLKLEPRTGVGGTGVTCLLEGAKSGKTIVARADIDALPVHEEKDVAYRSTVAGRMHACGHDGHTAILLAVAEVLAARRHDMAGRVLFVFQPAEEIVRGAEAMLRDGALDGLAPDHALGLHLTSNLPTGQIGLRSGPAMAATDSFDIVVHGSGGHAAKPNETVDPVVAAAHVVLALQTLVSRETDPVDQSVVSITSVEGGSAYNIIPNSVALKGTLRTFDADTRQRLRERIADVASGVASTYRARAEVRITEGSPAVVNDAAITERVREVAAAIVGADAVIDQPQIMGGDDMALWLQRAPGCYFFVGARGGDASAFPHHHPRFDIDEAALGIGIETLARSVLALLEP